LILEASRNRTIASVASASVRTAELVGASWNSSAMSGPTSNPSTTNTIAGVTDVPLRRRDTAATASTINATIARSHFMSPDHRTAFVGRHRPHRMSVLTRVFVAQYPSAGGGHLWGRYDDDRAVRMLDQLVGDAAQEQRLHAGQAA
jgi:hypothetical protein